MFVKVGCPILGMQLKMGQNGTRIGRHLTNLTWDILYERSLRVKNFWLTDAITVNAKLFVDTIPTAISFVKMTEYVIVFIITKSITKPFNISS